jgi:hypothetical protein
MKIILTGMPNHTIFPSKPHNKYRMDETNDDDDLIDNDLDYASHFKHF